MNVTSQNEVIAFLSAPGSHGADVRAVERRETHGSIVFLAGDHAYKLKRSVRFPYMDYSTPELRRAMSERELMINRRTAPQIYLEVRPIVRGRNGQLRFGEGGEDNPAVDWVLAMKRFDENALLEQMRAAGKLTRALMRRTAEIVAAFHREAEIAPAFGGSSGMRAIVEGNIAVLESMAGRPFADEAVARYRDLSRQSLARISDLLDRRRAEGYVRRCHGDLHLNNICLLHGEPTLFDAIEFNDAFACIDVLYDLAFLLMDLDRHDRRDLANAVFNHYLELSLEDGGLAAMPLFLSCRAAVRAHTAVSAALAASDGSEARFSSARRLLERAVGYLEPRPPRLIAIGGISGTGKSTLAAALAPGFGAAPGCVVLRSDVIRKQLMGAAETERLPESAYSPAITEEVYARISERAAAILSAGHSVIADAVYGRASERAGIAATAARTGTQFAGLWLDAPESVLEARLAARKGDASDATAAVMRAQMEFVSPPADWPHVEAGGPGASVLCEAQRILSG